MARHQKQIFAKENKYAGGVFKRFGRWFHNQEKWKKGLIIAVAVLLVLTLAIGGFAISKLNKLNRVSLNERELGCVDVNGYINILLLGVDTRDMNNVEGAGADAIMVLSIKEETGEVKLMSVYRDTYVKMGEEDYYDKITNANRIGGPQLMIKSLNQAMDLNISKFVVVNFKVVADLVDSVGGITVNVEDYEIQQLNKYTIQTANNIGKKDYQLVKSAGEQTLEGVQAVSYGRIRKGVGDDYKRTERMRIVLSAVFEKLKVMNVRDLNKMLNVMLPQVQTNLSMNDMLGLAARLVDFNISSGAGWPYHVRGGSIDGISYVFPDDLLTNTVELHEKMFDQEGYQATDVVVNMSNTIVGNIESSAKNVKTLSTDKDDKIVKKDKDKDKDTGKSDEDTGIDKADKKEETVDKESNDNVQQPTETPEKPETPETPREPEDSESSETPTEPESPVEPEVPVPDNNKEH